MAQAEDVGASPTRAAAESRLDWRTVGALWAGALAACVVMWTVDLRTIVPGLLIGPVDALGAQYLGTLSTVALVAAAIAVTAHRIGGPGAAAWRGVLSSITALGLVLALLLLAWPALLIGALVFSSDYRALGLVDGRELIVRRDLGLGQFPLQAGLRRGLAVDFTAAGDTTTDGNTALAAMRFHVEDGGDVVTVTYRPGPRPGRPVGVLTVPKER